MTDNILNRVDELVEAIGTSEDKVIPVLQAVQMEFNYIPEEALKRVCEITDITPSAIHGISTFYSQFRLKPVGKHIVKVCVGTACHVKGSMLVYDAFRRALKLEGDDDTDDHMLFTVEKVACLGCCTLAPVVQIDDVTYGHVGTEQADDILQNFLNRKNLPAHQSKTVDMNPGHIQGEVRIGLGSCCIASGSQDVKTALEDALADTRISVEVKQVGCVGICNQIPILE
ncbi:MAG TPA: NAD(P)H-dependent oxidoreductase subunit E, partial [Bacteroidales bacterium]|nr:NAD(P)H-dependent oxidoreductase subunit E [Bacteroidales bacterium]